jgi:hypothetical protein
MLSFRTLKRAALPYLSTDAATALLRRELNGILGGIVKMLRLGEQLGVAGPNEAHAVRLESALTRLQHEPLTPAVLHSVADDFKIVARHLRMLSLARPFSLAPQILDDLAAEFHKAE